MMLDVFTLRLYQEDLTSQIGNAVFYTSKPYHLGSLEVFINGLKQRIETDVEELSNFSFRFNVDVINGDIVDVVYETSC